MKELYELYKERLKFLMSQRNKNAETSGRIAEISLVLLDVQQRLLESILDKGTQHHIVKSAFGNLFEEIKHGDADHQKWLKDKMDKFLDENY